MERRGRLTAVELKEFLNEQSRNKPKGSGLLGGGRFFPLALSRRPEHPELEEGIISDKVEDIAEEGDRVVKGGSNRSSVR